MSTTYHIQLGQTLHSAHWYSISRVDKPTSRR